MRKIVSILVLIAVLFAASFCIAEESETLTKWPFEYIILGNGTAEIVGFYGSDTELIIPDELNGIKVTGIADEAFSRSQITKVQIPDCVTAVGANPFSSCYYLSKIILSPNHPTLEVWNDALVSKDRNELVCYPLGLKNESYSIPQGIEIIGPEAFHFCKGMKSVTIPDSVKVIGYDAFSQCHDLLEAVIPEGVESIGDCAFESCASLERVSIPSSVSYIGESAFPYRFGDDPKCEIVINQNYYAQSYCAENSYEFVFVP